MPHADIKSKQKKSLPRILGTAPHTVCRDLRTSETFSCRVGGETSYVYEGYCRVCRGWESPIFL